MLREDVVTACAADRFHVIPVETIDQGIEILTGVAAGDPDITGQYPAGTINQRIVVRLGAFAARMERHRSARRRTPPRQEDRDD
jgi:hypothetical protein